jgi:hypothetical protein
LLLLTWLVLLYHMLSANCEALLSIKSYAWVYWFVTAVPLQRDWRPRRRRQGISGVGFRARDFKNLKGKQLQNAHQIHISSMHAQQGHYMWQAAAVSGQARERLSVLTSMVPTDA